MTKRETIIESLGTLITEETWKGKYMGEGSFKDVIIDALNAGYNLAKEKFKKPKKKAKLKKLTTLSLVGCSRAEKVHTD